MAMLQLDHVVHYVNDLNEAIDRFGNGGLHAFLGGSHEQWGTYNALSYFGLTYVEFLAIEDKKKVLNSLTTNILAKDALELLPQNETINRIAIRTDNIEKVAHKLKEHSLNLLPILNGSRIDKEGRLIEWKMLMIDDTFLGLPYPFFIQWKETDEERSNRLKLKSHPIGDISLTSIIFHVNEPKGIAKHWNEVFNLPIIKGKDDSFSLAMDDKQLIFKKGGRNEITEVHFQTVREKRNERIIQIGKGKYVVHY